MTFTADDCLGFHYKHEEPLVISMDLNNHNVHRVLVDGGSAVNIIFINFFKQMILEEGEESLTKVSYPLIGFNGSAAVPRGKITLPVTVGQGQAARNVQEEFLVMDCDSLYNVIMGRTMIHKMQAIPSTLGDGSKDEEAKQDPSRGEKKAKRRKAGSSSLVKPTEVDARPETPSPEPDKEMEDISLEDDSNRSV
ncbi:uncharacterized protein [Spinacia oleracea]|uniref:Aspartic peptidase DDI1-type domain-containing protein n=1 Tax=Spinacia oleracea TaxID=3562 RepID=A0ABM3RJF2_SPIOL|nr:uncharacterized protein LOC130470142 [Spinacia oleracea]